MLVTRPLDSAVSDEKLASRCEELQEYGFLVQDRRRASNRLGAEKGLGDGSYRIAEHTSGTVMMERVQKRDIKWAGQSRWILGLYDITRDVRTLLL